MWFGNKRIEDHCWKPGLAFLRSQRSDVSLDNGFNMPITWQFSEIGTARLPFHYIRCDMKLFEFETVGQGYSTSLVQAMRQALAEAWERMWLRIPQKFYQIKNFYFSSSNGFAAGANSSAALDSARDELIERSVILMAWQNMTGWQPTRPKSLTFKLLRSALINDGWTVRLFKIEEVTFGPVLAVLATHPEKGSIFDSKTIGILPIARCESKLIHSIFRSTFAQSKFHHDKNALPDSGGPQDQAAFYRNPSAIQAFEFLDEIEAQQGIIELPDPQSIREKILFATASMPAVAVATHSKWPVLSWGKESIAGKNSWPHPLA
jgi:hypothetical protein